VIYTIAPGGQINDRRDAANSSAKEIHQAFAKRSSPIVTEIQDMGKALLTKHGEIAR
jgi:hypothetical protein